MANAENINKVVAIVQKASENDKTILVVSALGGTTDQLIQSAVLAAKGDESYNQHLSVIEKRHLNTVQELIPVAKQSSVLSAVKKQCNEIQDICKGIFLLRELSSATKDRVISFGELLSSQIIAAKCSAESIENEWKDSRELISTDNNYGSAKVDFDKTDKQIAAFFKDAGKKLTVVPGFIASGAAKLTTTLGRGGSDYTASILAAALNANFLEIWTDVPGIMTADPNLVSNAKIIGHISYHEAMELSHFGAKVIYPPTIQPVLKKNIPVIVKNTFAPEDAGTLIDDTAEQNGNIIRGITSIDNIALLGLEGSGMVGIPGFSKRLFEALATAQINVIMITQGSSEHSICVAIEETNAAKAKEYVDGIFSQEIAAGQVDPLIIETRLSIVAVVGDHMKNHPGISGKMFGALGRNGVNVRAIAQGSSERNISAVIFKADVKKAINVLHEEFFETSYKQVNLFVAGVGNVGSRLLSQLKQQRDYLFKHLRLQVK